MSDQGFRHLVSELLHGTAEPKTVEAISPQNVFPSEDDKPITKSGHGYFRLWLASLHLQHDQFLNRKLFPAVRSNVQFKFGDNSVEIDSVISPSSMLDVDKADAGHIVVENQPLTPLVPFNGGTIGMHVGLISMKGDDVLAGFIGAMEDFSKLVSASQISTALTTINTVNSGIEKLFDLGRDKLIAGYAASYAAEENALEPGYIAIINRPRGSVDPASLCVRNSRLMYGRLGVESAVPYLGVDYLLIRVETQRFRNDWRHIGKIDDLRKDAIDKLGVLKDTGGSTTIPDGIIKSAILEAYNSPDLSEEQRPKVAADLQAEYRAAKGVIEKSTKSTNRSAKGKESEQPVNGDMTDNKPVPSLHALLDVE